MSYPLSHAGDASTQLSKRFHTFPHPIHPRLHELRLAPAVVRDFLDRTAAIDVQNLEYVPFMRFKLAAILTECAGEDFATAAREIVTNRASGGFTASLSQVSDSPDDFVRFGTAVAHLLGPANHDSMSGTYYSRFAVRHTDDSDSYLRQAYRLFTLHTDGTFVNEATDWLLMMKFREENASGGESRLLHLDDWQELSTFERHRLGRKPLRYKAPGSKNVAEDVERPLFFESSFGLSTSFIDQFVQPETQREAIFLHDFSASMESSPGTMEVPLPVGELIVLNNYFWLHGRAPFQKNPQLIRELMRQRGTFTDA